MKHVYIIAEVGPNHNGDVNLALEMVEKIAATGVDAIKFQLSDPYQLYSDDSFKANYQKKNDHAKSAREMSLSFQLSHENHIRVYNRCKELGVDYMCTGFDMGSLKFLDEIDGRIDQLNNAPGAVRAREVAAEEAELAIQEINQRAMERKLRQETTRKSTLRELGLYSEEELDALQQQLAEEEAKESQLIMEQIQETEGEYNYN